MNSISSCCPAISGYGSLAAVKTNYSAMNLSRVTASSHETKDITLYTDEGDKVTLSYDQQTQAAYVDLKALSYGADFASGQNGATVKETLTQLQGEAFGFEDSRNLVITVDGNLSE